MFGVGWTEMLLIGVVALIVIGPKDLPVVMNRIGKAVATIRKLGTEFQREINKTTGLDQITDIRRSITEPLKQTAAEITREFNRVTTDGAVVPTGAIAPADPKTESVAEEIRASVGMAPAQPAMTPLPPAAPATAVESPAPAEAIAPVKPKRARKAAPKPDATTPAAKPAAKAKAPAKKPAAPRKPRAPKPSAEA